MNEENFAGNQKNNFHLLELKNQINFEAYSGYPPFIENNY